MKRLSFLAHLVIFLVFVSPYSSNSFHQLHQDVQFPSTHAEKLIHELNLFPIEDVNIRDRDLPSLSSSGGKRLVEKPFKFPNLIADFSVSVEELGHHAGYYKIEHSHAARLICEMKN